MFRKLASARYLKAQADDQGFWVGFSGKVSDRQHPPERPARQTLPAHQGHRIPRRELLGTTPTDREHLLDLLYEQLADT
jgi:hypothetical protein